MGYSDLANAVVEQAVKDYRAAAHDLRVIPNDQRSIRTIRSVERFFHSHWYEQLTNIDPEYLLNKLKGEMTR